MRGKQHFIFGCGFFPEALIPTISEAGSDCAGDLYVEDCYIVCDLSLYGIPTGPWLLRPTREITRDYWQGFGTYAAYFKSLLRPGDEAHAFAYVRDPAHRDVLMELDEACDLKDVKLRLHLF